MRAAFPLLLLLLSATPAPPAAPPGTVNLRADPEICRALGLPSGGTFADAEKVDLDRACRGTLPLAGSEAVRARRRVLEKLGYAPAEIDALALFVDGLPANNTYPTVFREPDEAFAERQASVARANDSTCGCRRTRLERSGRWTAELFTPNPGCRFSWLIGTIEPPPYCPGNHFTQAGLLFCAFVAWLVVRHRRRVAHMKDIAEGRE